MLWDKPALGVFRRAFELLLNMTIRMTGGFLCTMQEFAKECRPLPKSALIMLQKTSLGFAT